MIVLDTNVVSELMKTSPDARVQAWLSACRGDELATTSITVAEVGAGIEVLPSGARQHDLRARWQQMLAQGFGDRIYAFDKAAATVYGELFARRQRAGKPTGAFDLQIAAIAQVRGCRLATRNTGDFAGFGVEVINPWSASLPA